MREFAEVPLLTFGVRRMHALAWRPGAHMNDTWWRKLGLDGWQIDYRTRPGCRRALNALIVEKRGFPASALPAALSDTQERLIRLEHRLPALLVAIGFYTLQAPELMLLGEYRRQLARALGDPACDQLAALVPRRLGGPAPGESGRFLARTLELGNSWMQTSLGACPAWQALAIRLPPLCAGLDLMPRPSPVTTLFRMERLL
jgi:hypothetical protein